MAIDQSSKMNQLLHDWEKFTQKAKILLNVDKNDALILAFDEISSAIQSNVSADSGAIVE